MKGKIGITIGLVMLMIALTTAGATGGDNLAEQMNTEGSVLMIRHAYAPGTGDPAHFRIGDCSTQRNLNGQGREQARDIGKWLRAHGVDSAKIYSSQWCRCMETAELLGLGPVEELPGLNSFFDRPQDREPNLAAVRDFLSKQSPDGKLIILVTHYVTIAGITGEGVSSGAGVLLRLTGAGGVEAVGRVDFE